MKNNLDRWAKSKWNPRDFNGVLHKNEAIVEVAQSRYLKMERLGFNKPALLLLIKSAAAVLSSKSSALQRNGLACYSWHAEIMVFGREHCLPQSSAKGSMLGSSVCERETKWQP